MALLLLVRSEFVCWHAFLTSRRIDCQAADFAVGTGLKCDSKWKLGGEEIPLTFRTDPEFRKTPIGRRFVLPFSFTASTGGSMKNDGPFVSSRAVRISMAVPFGIQSGAIVHVGNGSVVLGPVR